MCCGVCASSLGLHVRARSHHAETLVCVCVCAHAVSRGIGDWQLRRAALHPLHSPPAQQLSTSTVPAASLYRLISRSQEEEKHSPWRGPRRFKPPEYPHRAGGRVAGHHDENTCVWKGGEKFRRTRRARTTLSQVRVKAIPPTLFWNSKGHGFLSADRDAQPGPRVKAAQLPLDALSWKRTGALGPQQSK